jgi:hypothetical protein
LYTGERGLTFDDLVVLESGVKPVDDNIVAATDAIVDVLSKIK